MVDELIAFDEIDARFTAVFASVFGETKVFSLSRVPGGRLRRVWNRIRGASTVES